MNEMLETIQIVAEGPSIGGNLPLKAAADVFSDIADALEGTSESLAQGSPAVSWVLESARSGSLVATIRPISLNPFGETIADETVRRVTSAIEAGKHGMDVDLLLSPKAAMGIRRLLGRVSAGEINSATIERGDLHVQIDQSSLVISHSASPIETFGSVEGELIGVKFGSSPFLTIRTHSTAVEVNCHFSTEEIDEQLIRASLRHRVLVAGIATIDGNGSTRRLRECELLRIFPTDNELPSPDDIAGIVPDFAGGQPAEAWVSANRA